MYLYTLSKQIKRSCKTYSTNCKWVTYESFQKCVTDYGWPSNYMMCMILSKAQSLKFYSSEMLRQVPVEGFLIDVKFFDCVQV